MKSEFDVWLEYGYEKDFITPQYCATHDPYEFLTDDEQEALDDDDDPCILVLRLKAPPTND